MSAGHPTEERSWPETQATRVLTAILGEVRRHGADHVQARDRLAIGVERLTMFVRGQPTERDVSVRRARERQIECSEGRVEPREPTGVLVETAVLPLSDISVVLVERCLDRDSD